MASKRPYVSLIASPDHGSSVEGIAYALKARSDCEWRPLLVDGQLLSADEAEIFKAVYSARVGGGYGPISAFEVASQAITELRGQVLLRWERYEGSLPPEES